MISLRKSFLLFLVTYFIHLFSVFSLKAENPEIVRQHGLSIYGNIKYPKDFSHYDYVNPEAPKGGEIRFSTLGTFDSFNPFVLKGNSAIEVQALLHVTLMTNSYDEPCSCYGYLAESVEVDPKKTWVIFRLRPKAFFHDGSSITADDVLYSFDALRTEGLPFYKNYFKDVKDAEKIDDYTIKFNLNPNSSREIPNSLGQFPILSKVYNQKNGFSSATLTPPLGSGPYKICDFKAGHFVKYQRIKNWWGENLPVNKGRYNFDLIRYDYFREDQVSFEAFKSHATDFRLEISAKNWKLGYQFPAFVKGDVLKEEVSDLLPAPMIGLIFNTRNSLFKSVKVRQALTEIFNFDWLNKNVFYDMYVRTQSYFDNSVLASSKIPVGDELELLKLYQDQLPADLFNQPFKLPWGETSQTRRTHLKKAKALLEEEGWIVENNKLIHSKTRQNFSFIILLHNPILEKAFQGFTQDLKQIGIEVHLQIIDSAQYAQRIETRNFDMIYTGIPQSLSPGNEQREFWGSASSSIPGSFNLAGVNNPVVDQMILKVIEARTHEALKTAVHALDRVLLWNYYMIPGWHGSGSRIAYWKSLKHPQDFPKYGMDLFAWWMDPAAQKVISNLS